MQTADPSLQDDDRREYLGVLARAPLAMLEAWALRQPARGYTWLRKPQTGLAMVRARAGGTGAKFNLGEMSVTRCALRLAGEGAAAGTAASGVAYVQGRSHRKAQIAALADALLQTGEAQTVRRELIAPLRARLEADAARMRRKAQATRVEFFTLAREGGE